MTRELGQTRRRPVLKLVATAFLAVSFGYSQIVVDDSFGPTLTLQGPDFQIPSDLGSTFDDNLFHSFDQFNLLFQETATFSGPGSIANILARVTGGNPSNIDGLLRSTISGANFFFMNPNGVVFGPNAQLDVEGSFAVTTADLIVLSTLR